MSLSITHTSIPQLSISTDHILSSCLMAEDKKGKSCVKMKTVSERLQNTVSRNDFM